MKAKCIQLYIPEHCKLCKLCKLGYFQHFLYDTSDFISFVAYSSNGLSPFQNFFEASTPALCEIWKPLAPYVEEKASLLTTVVERSRTSTAPSAFPVSDVSGMVWSTFVQV